MIGTRTDFGGDIRSLGLYGIETGGGGGIERADVGRDCVRDGDARGERDTDDNGPVEIVGELVGARLVLVCTPNREPAAGRTFRPRPEAACEVSSRDEKAGGKYPWLGPDMDAISTGLGKSGWCTGSYRAPGLDEEGEGGTKSVFRSMLMDGLLVVGEGVGFPDG